MKTNPRKVPVSKADLKRAKKAAVDEAVTYVSAIMMTVLVDKYGDREKISDFWRDFEKLSEEIKEGRVSVSDLVYTLKTEYDIIL